MRFRKVLSTLWTILILALCWIPSGWLKFEESESAGLHIPHLDKIVHGGIFTCFALLWMGAFGGRRPWLRILAAGVVLAVVSELGQNLPMLGRDGNVEDGLTDVAGLIVGLALSPLFERVLASFGLSPASAKG